MGGFGCRQIFETPDGGTIALDWLSFTDGMQRYNMLICGVLKIFEIMPASCTKTIWFIDTLPPSGFCPPEHESTPIVVVIPGLTSDSVASVSFTITCSAF